MRRRIVSKQSAKSGDRREGRSIVDFASASPKACRHSPRMEIGHVKKQTIVAAMLGLAIAGCANTRKVGPPEGPANRPVGMTPIPSLHETINRGVDSPAVAKMTLPDPSNPNWSARPYPPGSPPRGGAPNVATTTAGAGAAALAAQGQPPAQLPALAPEVGLNDPSAAPRVASGDPEVSPSSISPRPAASAPGEVIDPSPLPPVLDTLDTPGLEAPAATNDQADPANGPTPVPISGAAPTTPGQPPSASADPLLGANPQLMPSSLEGLASPEVRDPGPDNPAGVPAAAPAPTPTPAPAPATEPSAPAPAPAPPGETS